MYVNTIKKSNNQIAYYEKNKQPSSTFIVFLTSNEIKHVLKSEAKGKRGSQLLGLGVVPYVSYNVKPIKKRIS